MRATKGNVIRALPRCPLTGCEGGALKAGLVIDVLVAADGAVSVLLVDRTGEPNGAPVPPRWGELMAASVAAVPGVTGVLMQQRPFGSAAPSAEAYAARQRRVVENMSWMRCPQGEMLHPFGEGGGDLAASGLGVPVFCRMPLGGPTRPGTGLYDAASEPGRGRCRDGAGHLCPPALVGSMAG